MISSLDKIRHELSTEDAVALDVIVSDWDDIVHVVKETWEYDGWQANGLELEMSLERWVDGIYCTFLLLDTLTGIRYNVLVNQLLWADCRSKSIDKHYLYAIQALYTTNHTTAEMPCILEKADFTFRSLLFHDMYVRSLLDTTEVISKDVLVDAILKAINDVRKILQN